MGLMAVQSAFSYALLSTRTQTSIPQSHRKPPTCHFVTPHMVIEHEHHDPSSSDGGDNLPVVEEDDWISMLPRRSGGSFSFMSDPTFQAFVQGKSSVCHLPNALKRDGTSNTRKTTHDTISSIQQDARMLKALGMGVSAGVVSNPTTVPDIRKGVTQLWLQVPPEYDEQRQQQQQQQYRQSSSTSMPLLLTGNLDGRSQLYHLVEGIRQALEEPSSSTLREHPTHPLSVPNTRIRRSLPPDQVELSYLWYDGNAKAYYGKHIDTPQTATKRLQTERNDVDGGTRKRRIRSVSFLLYLGGVTDEPWDLERHGGHLRIFAGDDPYRSNPADEGDPKHHASEQHSQPGPAKANYECNYFDVVPEAGTLVLFDSATIAHEVLPTQRDRLAVVGWFGTMVAPNLG